MRVDRHLLCLPMLLAATLVAAPALALDPAGTVDAYHAALHNKDTGAALALLAQDATLFEQGFVERTRSDYAGPHIAADAEFASAVSYAVVDRRLVWLGDNAVLVLTQNHVSGVYDRQKLDLVGTETVLLRRAGDGWQIQHVHASAHPGSEAPVPAPAKP